MVDNDVTHYTLTNGLHTWVASQLSLLHPDSCRLSNVYTITFSSADFPFANPAVHFLREIYDVVNSGEFHFNIKGCCCGNTNNNPNYKIETLIAGYDYCFIPMSRVYGNSEIHCPGCNMPGTIVTTPDDQILERTNFGFTDVDDNGLAEFPLTRIDAAYLNTNRQQLDIGHSMVGDSLSSLMNVRIDDSGQIDLDSLVSLGIHLKYLYAEQKIEKSNSSQFDVHPFQITITARGQSATLTPSNPLWNQIVKDVRDSVFQGAKYDLIFYNLSTAVLGNLFSISNYTFNSFEEISLRVLMRVCKNYQVSRTSKTLADNQHQSKVSLNMYLTDINLDSLGIYHSFTHHLDTIAQEDPGGVARPERLYMCETKSAMHYFYSIYARSLSYVWEDPNAQCIRNLQLEHEIAIGGEKVNPFRFEFRPIPEFFPIQVTLPTGISNYRFYGNGTGSTYVRTNYTNICGIPSLHRSNTPANLIFSSSINYTHSLSNENLIAGSAFPLTCGSPFTNQSGTFYSGDEYLKQSLSFPFTYTVCNNSAAIIDSAMMNTNLTLSTCSLNPIQVLNERSTQPTAYTITSNYVNQIQISQPNNVAATRHREKWSLHVFNNYIYDRSTRHLFIYFNDTTIYNNISVEGWTPQFLALPNGKRIVYFPLDSVPGVVFDSTRSINVDINDCSLDSIPFFIGFDCLSYPTLLQLQNGTTCQLDTGYLPLQIEEPRVSGLIDQNDSITTCQIDTVNASCEIFGSNIYNFKFKMNVLNPSMQLISERILKRDSGNTVSSVPFTTIQPGQNNYEFIPAIQADSIQSGDQLVLEVVFSMLDTTTTSPFSVDYSYTNLCGDAGPPAVQDTVYHRPLVIGSFNCSQGVANCFRIIATQNTINCTGSPISIGTSTIGQATGLSYVWASNPAGFTATSATITPSSPAVTTTYTVIATNSSGTTSSASVTVLPFSGECCIPAGFSLAVGDIFLNKTGASAFVQQNYTNYISTSNKILIADTFTVDTNFTFAGCSNIIMAPGALINVLPNRLFIVDDSHMYSCGSMSRGINAQANAIVRLKGSVIEDAQYAVNLDSAASFRSVANYFKNNYISVNAVSTLTANNSMPVQLNISNTVFESTRSLSQKYATQNPLPLTHPLTGIYLTNITNVTINPDTGNVFRNLNVGILGIRTNLSVSNCKFQNILVYDSYLQTPRLLGTAIYAKGSLSGYTVSYTGRRDSLSADFENCVNGIRTKQMSLVVTNSYLKNVDIGIESERTNLATISIKYNTIDCNLTGISMLSNLSPSSFLVYENLINGGFNVLQNSGVLSNAIGIDLQGNNNQTQFGVRDLVASNTIRLGDYGNTGIHLNYSRFMDVVENLISLENDRNTSMTGVVMENSQQSLISCNDIHGSRSDQSIDYDEAAIRYVSSMGNEITQNYLSFTSQGIDVIGVCDNGIDQTTIKKNLLGFHFNGLRYRGSAVVNEQNHNGNRWIAPFNYPGWGAMNLNTANALNFQYVVNGVGQSMPPDRDPSGWFVPDGLPDSLLDFSDCNNWGTSNPKPIPSLIKLSDDSIKTIEYHQELDWQSKVNVYMKLIEHPEYMVDNPDLADFYATNAATSIHYVAHLNIERDQLLVEEQTILDNIENNAIDIYEKSTILKQIYKELENINLKQYEIDSLLLLNDHYTVELDLSVQLNDFYQSQLKSSLEGKLELISQLTDSIQGTEIYEINENLINEIESYTYEHPEEDSITQFETTLTSIATQCPLTGGVAVFKARAFLKEINPNLVYNDAGTCIQSGIVYRKKEITYQFCKLYPNPTNGTLTISYSLSSDVNLTVTDITGRNILSKNIESKSSSTTLDLSKHQTGIYFYRLSNNSDVLFNGKIVLTK